MRRFLYIGTGLLAVFLLSGCSSMNMPHGGTYPGAIYADQVYPSMKDSFTQFKFSPNDFDVLGTVTGQGESMNVLMIFSQGDNGYQSLLAQAQQKYPNTDALINFYWDTKYFNIGWPYPPLPIYQRVQSQVTATAIKFKKKK
jgi:hypothetical protein